MFQAEAPSSNFDFVVSRLKAAGWISAARFEPGIGYILDWTVKGRQRALLLQELLYSHDLNRPKRPKQFHDYCTGKKLVWKENKPSQVEADFWSLCIEEIGIGNDPDELQIFVSVLSEWKHA